MAHLASNPAAGRTWRGRLGWTLFTLVVLWLAVSQAASYLFADAEVQMAGMSPRWYGSWSSMGFAVAFFSLFVLAFLRSPRKRGWRHLGLSEAYLVALFTEMYGVPFTIYLLGSVLGVNLGFGMLQGHLWAVLIARLGLLPLGPAVELVMAVSSMIITFGLAAMAAGWWQVWRAKGGLVTTGLYSFSRHPQYFGFLLVIIGFLIMWPTIPTLILFPVMIVVYTRLAKREERDMEAALGPSWREYRLRTPLLIPRWPRRGSEPPGDQPQQHQPGSYVAESRA